jgi:uncharacterized protein YqeY
MTDTFGIKDLNEQKIGSEYAPKRKPDLGELERAMAETPKYYPYNSPSASEVINAIKENIKKLTHRQMREMCKAIFEAHHKNAVQETGKPSITDTELPDVLDRFAHGD